MGASVTLLNLAGNVALLLWGLYMVQTGVMRAFGTDIRRFLGKALRSRFKGFFAGLFATTLVQSSTAVGLMATSFAASKMIGLVPAMAVMLGANVGSTIIVQALSFDHSAVAPMVVLIGFITFKRTSRTNIQDFCRAIIGLGLMLIALQQMMALLKPAEDSQSIKLLLDTISKDHLLDMVFAAALTWVMHSSVAVVLVAMSFAAQGLVPLDVACALVLGANLGSAVNPLIESAANGNPAAHRLPFGNLINRACGCLIFLPLLPYIDRIPEEYTVNMPRAVASFHTIFNIVMALIFFPLLSPLARLLQHMFAGKSKRG
jgi:phosphate:Na+ symporter